MTASGERMTAMSEKNKKLIKWAPTPLNDLDGLKAYLEEMALKGWMLEKIGNSRLTLGRYQPQKLIYSVEAFDKANQIDDGVTPRNAEFVEMCAAGGWHFIASCGYVQVFCTADENPVPIQTDLNIKLRMLDKSMLKDGFGLVWSLPLLFFINALNTTMGPFDYLLRAFNPYMFLAKGFLYLLLAVYAVQLLSQLVWYLEAKKAVGAGAGIPDRGNIYLVMAVVIWCAISALVIGVSVVSGVHEFLIALLICAGVACCLALINEKTQTFIKIRPRPLYFAMIFFLGIIISDIVLSFA